MTHDVDKPSEHWSAGKARAAKGPLPFDHLYIEQADERNELLRRRRQLNSIEEERLAHLLRGFSP